MAGVPLLLDSGFAIALVLKADQHHAKARSIWQRITSERRPLVTTTFVLDEIVTFLNSRGEHELAVDTGNQLMDSPAIEMIDVNLPLVQEAWRYFVNHCDKSYSLTDSISFVIMSKRNMVESLTFDRHFTQAGFFGVS
jgi:uncharacterized protein